MFDHDLGESGGTPRQIVDVQAQRADLRAALAHARREPRVDPRRVALWGTSPGGRGFGHAALILNMPALDVVSGANIEAKRKSLGLTRGN